MSPLFDSRQSSKKSIAESRMALPDLIPATNPREIEKKIATERKQDYFPRALSLEIDTFFFPPSGTTVDGDVAPNASSDSRLVARMLIQRILVSHIFHLAILPFRRQGLRKVKNEGAS